MAETPPVRTGTHTNRETASPVYTYGDVVWGPVTVEVAPTQEALAVGRRMAECAVDRVPDRVRQLLAAEDRAAFAAAVQPLKSPLGRCMVKVSDAANEFAFQPMFLAGLLAEAWIRKKGAPKLVAGPFDPNAPKLDWVANSSPSLVQVRLSECLATRHPDYVAPFVAATPNSPQEAAGFRALVPLVATCLDKNVTLQAKRSPLKLAMAFAYFRRTALPEVATR